MTIISGHRYTADNKVIPPDRYDIHNMRTGERVGQAKTRTGADRSVERNDMKYGGYAHRAIPFYNDAKSPKDT